MFLQNRVQPPSAPCNCGHGASSCNSLFFIELFEQLQRFCVDVVEQKEGESYVSPSNPISAGENDEKSRVTSRRHDGKIRGRINERQRLLNRWSHSLCTLLADRLHPSLVPLFQPAASFLLSPFREKSFLNIYSRAFRQILSRAEAKLRNDGAD